MVLEVKALGKLVTPKPKSLTKPRSCMVLGLKLVGKLVILKPKC